MRKKVGFWTIFIVVFILLTRWVLIYLNPVGSLDTAWSFAISYSLLNGQVFFNHFDQHAITSFYGYLGLPIFSLYGGKYSIFILFELVRITFCFFLFKFLIRQKVLTSISILICLLFYLDRQLLYQRQEAILMPLIFLYQYISFSNPTNQFKLALFFFVILLFLHPVAALFHSIIFVALNLDSLHDFKQILKQKSNITGIIVVIGCMAWFYHSSFYQVMSKELIIRLNNDFNILEIRQFIINTFPLTFFLIYLRVSQGRLLGFLVTVLIFVLIISYFSGFYYYTYLQLYLVLSFAKVAKLQSFGKDNLKMNFGKVFVVISIMTSLIHPCFIYYESKDYVKTIHTIFEKVETYDSKYGNTYIDPGFALPLLHQPSCRMAIHGVPFFQFSNAQLVKGDVIMVTEVNDLSNVQNYFDKKNVVIEEIVPPSIGVLSLTSLYRKRVNQYGLWKCTVME